MNSKSLSRIYKNIEDKQERIIFRRGETIYRDKRRGGDGIAVLKDEYALRWQKAERVKHHVGVHFCIKSDTEHGMEKQPCAICLGG